MAVINLHRFKWSTEVLERLLNSYIVPIINFSTDNVRCTFQRLSSHADNFSEVSNPF